MAASQDTGEEEELRCTSEGPLDRKVQLTAAKQGANVIGHVDQLVCRSPEVLMVVFFLGGMAARAGKIH